MLGLSFDHSNDRLPQDRHTRTLRKRLSRTGSSVCTFCRCLVGCSRKVTKLEDDGYEQWKFRRF